jgi:hypothetical protein
MCTLAYFLDSFEDLARTLVESLDLKGLTKRALDKKLPLEVRLKLVDALSRYGEDARAPLERIAKKSKEEELKKRAGELLKLLEKR